MFFASTMVMVSIALVMAVIVTNIYAKKDSPQRCPAWTVRLASRFYPVHYLPDRRRTPQGGYCYKQFPTGPPLRREPLSISGLNSNSLDTTPTCDCRGCRASRPEVDDEGDDVIGNMAASPRLTHDTFDFELSQAEWKMVAKFTDRMFFWLFFAMSLFVQFSLFKQMIPETRGLAD